MTALGWTGLIVLIMLALPTVFAIALVVVDHFLRKHYDDSEDL